MKYFLIVDDDKLICDNIESKLKRLGYLDQYIILKAASATEAEILFDQHAPSVVITDIHMPGVNGLSLIERITQKPNRAAIYVLSGYDDYEYVRAAFLLGVTDYLLKPLDIEDLDSKLKKLQSGGEAAPSPKEPEGAFDAVRHALDYIDGNISRSLSMREVADYVGLSYNYFSKLFRESTRMHFSDYIHQRRVDIGKKYLMDPSVKIQDIARKLGYENPSEFSRAFKKYAGCYPTEYRERSEPE